MPIVTDFEFAHQVVQSPGQTLLRGAPAPVDLLGALRGFVGTATKRTWSGTGFNLIWRPNHGQSGPKDFFLELNLTTETLDFNNISGTGVADRGFNQTDISLGALAYLQQISDKKLGPQHFEPGLWTNVPSTTNPNESATVARMGSIPHGTTINLQGTAITAAKPLITATSITPFTIGSPDDGVTGLVPFPEEKDIATNMPSRTALADVPGLTDDHLANPNLFLLDAIAKQTFVSTTVLIVTSDVTAKTSPIVPAPAAPNAGGGTDNIAFLSGTTNSPNANTARVSAIFWIEHVKDEKGNEFDQLQYTQRVLLNFNGLSWPHITVATLR